MIIQRRESFAMIDDRLVAYRQPDSEQLDFKINTLKEVIPGLRECMIDEARQKAKAEREEKRAKQ